MRHWTIDGFGVEYSCSTVQEEGDLGATRGCSLLSLAVSCLSSSTPLPFTCRPLITLPSPAGAYGTSHHPPLIALPFTCRFPRLITYVSSPLITLPSLAVPYLSSPYTSLPTSHHPPFSPSHPPLRCTCRKRALTGLPSGQVQLHPTRSSISADPSRGRRQAIARVGRSGVECGGAWITSPPLRPSSPTAFFASRLLSPYPPILSSPPPLRTIQVPPRCRRPLPFLISGCQRQRQRQRQRPRPIPKTAQMGALPPLHLSLCL